MKKIEDYLHLYLGCEVRTNDRPLGNGQTHYGRTGTFIGFTDHTRISCRIAHRAGPEGCINTFLLRPLLRPLSDMTEEEALHCVGIAYHSVYDHAPEFIRTEMVDSNNEAGAIVCEEPGWKYGFSVTKTGIDFSANGDFLHIPVFEITRYLLSKGFDLFGLFEAGLAIETPSLLTNQVK
jgi:hypothetical protein